MLGWLKARVFGGDAKKTSDAPPPPPSSEIPSAQVWPYSKQYSALVAEAQRGQPTTCGSPSFIWHMGLWPKRDVGEKADVAKGADADADTTLSLSRRELDGTQKQFFREISDFLTALQMQGCAGSHKSDFEPRRFETKPFDLYSTKRRTEAGDEVHPFLDVAPHALSFTLWWRDDDATLKDAGCGPGPDDLRISVLAEAHYDHATITLIIDAGQSYETGQFGTTAKALAHHKTGRRAKIARYLEHVRAVTGDQIRDGRINKSRLPEEGVDGRAETLLEATEYFYDGVWEEFQKAFSAPFFGAEGPRGGGALAQDPRIGVRFADFRGCVMSVRGLETTADARRRLAAERLRSQNAPSTSKAPGLDARFRSSNGVGQGNDVPDPSTGTTGMGAFDIFDEKAGEPNAVLKSYWPFIRRMARWADYRQVVGCGILSWRALYVSAMGAGDDLLGDEESPSRAHEAPANHLPPGERIHRGAPRDPNDAEAARELAARAWSRPSRYLVLTKGEPNRAQIGRFVERINELGTKRLFALKYVTDVKNASNHLRLIGNALDGVLSTWSRERREIEDEAHTERVALGAAHRRAALDAPAGGAKAAKVQRALSRLPTKNEEDIERMRIKRIQALVERNENDLIRLGGRLDHIFQGGVGRFAYAVNRSNYFADEFERLYPSLEIGNVDGWMNYGQFVERGPKPAFSYIRAAGERLISLRQRLQVVTETIQTTALVAEMGATRNNTDTLSKFARLIRGVSLGTGLVAAASFTPFIYEQLQTQCAGFWFDYLRALGVSTPACDARKGPATFDMAAAAAFLGPTAAVVLGLGALVYGLPRPLRWVRRQFTRRGGPTAAEVESWRDRLDPKSPNL